MLIKDWIFFSRSQQRGIIVLLLLIILTPVSSSLITRWKLRNPPDRKAFISEIEQLEAGLDEIAKTGQATDEAGQSIDNDNTRRITLEPFRFDPNTLPPEGWEEMGAPENLGRTIGNYLAAGGSFRYKEDLQRIYTMTDDLFDQLAPYIDLPDRADGNPPGQSPSSGGESPSGYHGNAQNEMSGKGEMDGKERPTVAGGDRSGINTDEPVARTAIALDINSADSAAFRRVPGIGPVFSSRIVRYRELVGGFYETGQLLEVYGLDSSHYQQIKSHLFIDPSYSNRQIDLNKATFSDLIRHPYLNRNQVNAILRLREQHGPFRSTEDIRRSHLIDEKDWRRLSPYITVADSLATGNRPAH